MAEFQSAIDELECSVCMDRLVSPLVLPCHHSFCKECLESFLQFDDKGCAKLYCPNQCLKVTKVEKHQTLDDVLAKIFTLESLLNKVNGQIYSEIVNCQQKHDQNIPCSHYCQTCHKTSCKSCFEEHACEEEDYINIAYDGPRKSFQPICEEHQSFVRHICRECNNQLLCVYCKHRRHRNHDVIELDSYVEKVKENFTADYQIAQKLVPQLQQLDEELVKKYREELSEELFIRRMIRVNSYITHLYEEESKILKQFDDRTNSFIQQKPSKLESFTEVESLLDNKNNIHTLAMISEQDVLLQKLQDIVKELSLKFVLTDLTSDNHLGELRFEKSNSHAFQNSFTKDNVHEMILSANLRNVQKFHEEASSQMMEKYKYYASVEIKDVKELTDLKMAIVFGHEKDAFKYLMAAVKENNSKMLKMILECTNVDINMKEDCGEAPLIDASENGNSECVKLLLEHNCDIDITNNKGNTALIVASYHGHIECVKLLLEHNCNIDFKNMQGGTALCAASYCGNSECVKLLLDHNCHIDIKHKLGATALMLACLRGHSECVKLLLERNCNIDIRDNNGDTALDYASGKGHHDCVAMLKEVLK